MRSLSPEFNVAVAASKYAIMHVAPFCTACNVARWERLHQEKAALEMAFERELQELQLQQEAELAAVEESIRKCHQAEAEHLKAEHRAEMEELRTQQQEQVREDAWRDVAARC